MTQLAPPRNCNGTNLSIKKEKLSPFRRGESQLSPVVETVVLFQIPALPTSPPLGDHEPLGLEVIEYLRRKGKMSLSCKES